jgi:hypothetical protein
LRSCAGKLPAQRQGGNEDTSPCAVANTRTSSTWTPTPRTTPRPPAGSCRSAPPRCPATARYRQSTSACRHRGSPAPRPGCQGRGSGPGSSAAHRAAGCGRKVRPGPRPPQACRSLPCGGDAHAQETDAQVVATGAAFLPTRVAGDRPPPPAVPSPGSAPTGGIVERSTARRSAASLMVVSPRTSCSQTSYFCNGVRNRLARRPSRSVPRSNSVMVRPSSSVSNPSGCCLIQSRFSIAKSVPGSPLGTPPMGENRAWSLADVGASWRR